MTTRTTLRLDEQLKKQAERVAIEENTTLQDVFNQALAQFLDQKAQAKARKIVFKTHNLGRPLDKLTRKDFYPNP